MPATEPGPQPDTKPPSPAVESKPAGGKKAPAATAQQPAVADTAETAAATPETAADADGSGGEAEAEPPPREPEPGWFRNTAATPLIVIPHLYPSKTLAPGEATWLPDDQRHPNLERCDAPAPDAPAADTAGSEQ